MDPSIGHESKIFGEREKAHRHQRDKKKSVQDSYFSFIVTANKNYQRVAS
jgi:hypothetical protein